jgi:hypothetical protein
LRLLAEVMTEPMFLLLVACGAIYLLLGDRGEALMLLGFVFGQATVGARRRCHDGAPPCDLASTPAEICQLLRALLTATLPQALRDAAAQPSAAVCRVSSGSSIMASKSVNAVSIAQHQAGALGPV